MRKQSVAVVIGLAAGLSGSLIGPVSAQNWRTMTSARHVWDHEPMSIEIGYGAGELRIAPAEAPFLYQMEIRYDADKVEPEIEFDDDDNELALGIRSIREGRNFDHREGSSATISLTREVPLDLDLEFGAGEANIELGGISLRTLSLSTGASDTDITFSEPNRIAAEEIEIHAGAADLTVIGLGNTRAQKVSFEGGVGATVLDFSGVATNMNASVDMGVGTVKLRLPRTHGIQINRDSFLSSFNAPGLQLQGDAYYSANWTSSDRKLVIDVSAAFGSVDVEWID